MTGLPPFVASARALAGRRVMTLLATVIPVGVLLGGAEILLGSSIYLCMVRFGLLERTEGARLQVLIGYVDPVILLVVLGALTMGLRYLNQFLPEKAGESLNHRVRVRVGEELLAGYRERIHLSAQQVSRVLGVLLPNAAGFFNSTTQLLGAAILMGILLIGLLHISLALTVIAVLAMVCFGAPLILSRPLTQRFAARVHAARSEFMRRAVTDAQNLYFLKISGANMTELAALIRGSREISRSYQLYAAFATLTGSLPQFMAILMILALLLTNQWYPLLTAGQLVVFIYLLSRLANTVSHAAVAAAHVQFTRPFLTDLMGMVGTLFSDADAERPGVRRLEGVREITLENVAVGRGMPVLEGVNLTVRPGDVLVITGPSGRGKSTLLMTIIGVLSPLAGEVRWNGLSAADLDPSAQRKLIGYAGAEPYLFNGTVRENLLLGLEGDLISDADLRKAIEMACATFVDELDGGLEHVLREGGEGVSGGQKQRLSLARAFLRAPEVMVLDEAFANIDEATEAGIMSNLRSAFPRALVIAVSHRSSMQAYATQVYPLESEEI